MKFFLIIVVVCVSLAFISCLNDNSDKLQNINESTTKNYKIENLKEFLIGRWEGRNWSNGEEDALIMTIHFEENNLAKIKYSKTKRVIIYQYKIDENNNLSLTNSLTKITEVVKVEANSENQIGFYSEGVENEVDIWVLYYCKFYRSKS